MDAVTIIVCGTMAMMVRSPAKGNPKPAPIVNVCYASYRDSRGAEWHVQSEPCVIYPRRK